MKAIILHQPYATLVAIGVKEWETRGAPPNGPMRPDGVRGMPGLAIEPGERGAIAAAKGTAEVIRLGRQLCTPGDRTQSRAVHHALDQAGYVLDTATGSSRAPLPLGAVVCTAVVAEALPIVSDHTQARFDCIEIAPDLRRSGWRLRLFRYLGLSTIAGRQVPVWKATDISDQLPYGHWEPGRWAWRLTDVEQVDAPVEVVRGNRQGVFEAEVER